MATENNIVHNCEVEGQQYNIFFFLTIKTWKCNLSLLESPNY